MKKKSIRLEKKNIFSPLFSLLSLVLPAMPSEPGATPPLRLAVLGAGTFARAAWAPLLR